MTSPINVDAIASMLQLLGPEAEKKIALDVIFKHEIGCTCAMCESIRSRFPSADASHPDRFEEQGGAHETYPFDATNTVQLQSIAKSLGTIAVAVERGSAALESARDVLRGRDSENKVVNGPLRAIADFLLRGQPAQPAPSPPQTQRNPVQQQLPMQQVAPVPVHGATQKRIATDAEMSGDRGDPKIRCNINKGWGELGKPQFKGLPCSRCDPEFLELYATQLDRWVADAQKLIDAGTADDKARNTVKYDSLDAARARGWAQRIRSGAVPQAPPPPPAYSGGSDLI